MKKVSLIALVFTGVLFFVNCDKTDKDKKSTCGSEQNQSKHWGNFQGIAPWDDPTWNFYTEGNFRVFQVSLMAHDNVCPDEHIVFNIHCVMIPDQPRNIQVRVKYRYGAFGVFGSTYTPVKAVLNTGIDYSGESNFGIKNAYGSEPGAFYFMLEWVIDNFQDYSVDFEYFKYSFYTVDFNYRWYSYPN